MSAALAPSHPAASRGMPSHRSSSDPGQSRRVALATAARSTASERPAPAQQFRRPKVAAGHQPGSAARGKAPAADRPEHPILFQQFFKSVGPRTYAVQVKKATNGNHYIVFTEGRRDDKTDDVRKTRINIFSEDFDAFFDLLREAAQYVKAHPLPPDFVAKRKKMWASIAKKGARSSANARPGRGAGPGHAAHDASGRSTLPPEQRSAPAPAGPASEREPHFASVEHGAHGTPQAGRDRLRQEPPATSSRARSARPLPTARAAAGA